MATRGSVTNTGDIVSRFVRDPASWDNKVDVAA
jgi:hypothetical protein